MLWLCNGFVLMWRTRVMFLVRWCTWGPGKYIMFFWTTESFICQWLFFSSPFLFLNLYIYMYYQHLVLSAFPVILTPNRPFTTPLPPIYLTPHSLPHLPSRPLPLMNPVLSLPTLSFPAEEYTKIQTPRQEVIFKKSSLDRRQDSLDQSSVTGSTTSSSTADGAPGGTGDQVRVLYLMTS